MSKPTTKVIVIIHLFLLSFVSNTSEAKVKPATIFGDNMVLQQQQKSQAIWGTAQPGKTVKITTSWNNQTYPVTADSQGRWRTTISTPAAGGPFKITFTDGEKTILNNILVGEVWLCSGQSNMEMPMKGFPGQPLETTTNIDIAVSANDRIRLFNIERNSTFTPQDEVKGNWSVASPADVCNFSATAYYFARLLQKNLNIPIGVITSHWGASSIEAWMSREMLADFPEVVLPTSTTDSRRPQQTPAALYNGMLHPIIGLNLQGMIWYQGEANVDNPVLYGNLFENFVKGLRKEWKIGEFPFYYCQIAPYPFYKVNSAFLREAQMEAESKIPNSGMAVLMDAGSQACIHPQMKQTAGERLALQALGNTYKQEGFAYQSPTYKDIKIQNDTVVISFNRAPMGVTSYYKPLRHFTLAGEDRKFYPAKAWIKDRCVYLVSEEVKKPITARYAFENYVQGDLFSVEGLPVSSFRTDKFIE